MDNFSDISADRRSDCMRSLPRDAFHEIILVLRGALPPPLTDDPADEARRDRAALAGVAALQPVNAAEGRLAAQFVAADAWAMDCLRLAQVKRREPDIAHKCRAQAMSLMREGKSSLRLLLRLQAARQKVEADEASADRAAWAEHGAAGMMAEALSPAPAPADEARQAAPAEGDMAPRAGAAKFRIVAENATISHDVATETDARIRRSGLRFAPSGLGSAPSQPEETSQ